MILGIDPGLAVTGFGLIGVTRHGLDYVASGVIRTKGDDLCKRLAIISDDLLEIVKKYNPVEAAVEELFFAKNSKTAILVGHARGAILLTLADRVKKFAEYTPLQVKQSLTGYGRAEKRQVQEMVKAILSLRDIPRPVDAADALAVAVCHADSRRN